MVAALNFGSSDAMRTSDCDLDYADANDRTLLSRLTAAPVSGSHSNVPTLAPRDQCPRFQWARRARDGVRAVSDDAWSAVVAVARIRVLAVMRQLALQRIGAHLASVSRIHRSSSYFALRPTAAGAVAAFEPALTLAAAAVVMLSYLDAR